MKTLPKTCWRRAFLVLASSSCEGNDDYSKNVLAASCSLTFTCRPLSLDVSLAPLLRTLLFLFPMSVLLFFHGGGRRRDGCGREQRQRNREGNHGREESIDGRVSGARGWNAGGQGRVGEERCHMQRHERRPRWFFFEGRKSKHSRISCGYFFPGPTRSCVPRFYIPKLEIS